MESLLSDVNAVVGVTGSFIADRKGKLLARALPPTYDGAAVELVARTMMQTFTGLETARRRKVGDIDVVFKEGRLIMKPFGEGCVGIVTVPRINVALLNLTASAAVRRIHEEIKQRAAAQPEPAAIPRAAAPAAPAAPAPAAQVAAALVAAAPVKAGSPREAAALDIVQTARDRKLVLRVMGDTAVRLRCPTASTFPPTENDEILELVTRGRQSADVEHLMKERGINAESRFNMLHASERLRFVEPEARLPIEVFLDAFEAFHRIELADRLQLDEVTLPLSDLLLLELQVVDSTPQEQKRILSLLADHAVGDGADNIDPARITEVCADDWGWYKTVTVNLENAIKVAPTMLKGEQPGIVEQRARQLIKGIEDAPKSMGWQIRARLGERRPWYNVPE
jgi:predicted regulator of Ras-like GTPase activity (Roadblock/LC7/MglB family)